MLRLAHAPVAVARRRERHLGGALSLAQLRGQHWACGACHFVNDGGRTCDVCGASRTPPLGRRYLKPTPLDKLDQWSLSHAAGYLSWWEVVILRRLLSKGVALVAARADDGEVYSRARALHLMFRWMVAWNVPFMSQRGLAWGRNLDLMSPAMLREYIGASRRDRKFSARTDELLAAVRTGTQLSKAARAGGAAEWATLARTLEADVCATCLRCSKQRLVRTGRIVAAPVGRPVIGFADKDIEPCPDCDLMEWARALTQFRLTPEQLPRGPVVRRW